MISKHVEVNGKSFRVTLTDQVIAQVNSLRGLYDKAYEDPDTFDQISSDISSAIKEIAACAEPEASDADLDGLIQEIMAAVDNRAAEVQQQMSGQGGGDRKRRR